MKKTIHGITIAGLVFFITSCGSSSETREKMERSAKRMSDSIQALIDSSWKLPASIIKSQKISMRKQIKIVKKHSN